MALAVNSKPSGFRPVGGGELLYIFTEASMAGKENYRVEIELNGLGLSISEFRPDASLVITADIAPMLRAALAMVEATGSRLKNTYVKYQAKWDASSDAQVPLAGDVIYFYVGVDHDLNHRTKFQISASGGPFLIPTAKLYAWDNRTAYVEFLNDSDLNASSEVVYTPTGGAPVQILAFDGSVKGLRSVGYKFPSSGVVKVARATAPYTIYASINVEVAECSYSNPVHLKWINDNGGLTSWLFNFNQIFGLLPQVLWRDKTLDVEADVLVMEQWLLLQELHKAGIEYGANQKSGIYCKDMTIPASELTVFPLADFRDTPTKMTGHKFSISLRYPQIPNIQI